MTGDADPLINQRVALFLMQPFSLLFVASSKYIWRYVNLSDEQTEQALENLF
jgi:hypothetical protein